MNRIPPTKRCLPCGAFSANGCRTCRHCGAPFSDRHMMSLTSAARMLMQAASDTPIMVEAWTVMHRKAYGWHPTAIDYEKAGLTPPVPK